MASLTKVPHALGRLRSWLFYAGLSLIVLWPLLGSGYIFTLDLAFVPHIRIPPSVTSSYLFYVLLHLLNILIPGDVLEKLVLLVVLLGSGVGMHLLARRLLPEQDRLYRELGAYVAGVFFMINPFTYDRFMAGQFAVLLGYALLPWCCRSLLVFLQHPDWRSAVRLGLWTTVVGIVSIHTLGLLAILYGIGLLLSMWRQRHERMQLLWTIRWSLVSLGLFLVASSYWFIPLLFDRGKTATIISGFGASDRAAFATVGGSWLGKLGNIAHLQGFWAEQQNLYLLPQAHLILWQALSAAVWMLIIVGIVRWFHGSNRLELLLLGLSSIVGGIAAVGLFNAWLAAHIALFAGYREPQKFAGLVALFFGVCIGYGAMVVLQYLSEQGGRVLVALGGVMVLLLPLAWTPPMLWGFGNQLVPLRYPADWYRTNQRLDEDTGTFQVLFLPWHEYMSFNFAGRIIANPAQQFFDKPVITSNNPEFDGIPPSTPNQTVGNIGAILQHGNQVSDLGPLLARYHVKYVLLDLDDDYADYAYLNRQSDFQLVAKGPTLKLYRNTAF